ncbi:hypothetical protein GA0074704_0656 [Micromonospora siamensis]|uniref:Uncharacterized protein n=1 Tax=Micromonospora siamensis TaxID=299152 RepID=A0A1C5GWY5_9ACTN|nr:hypothetical protein GA0074704_0656 [Micromonospora siamensis]
MAGCPGASAVGRVVRCGAPGVGRVARCPGPTGVGLVGRCPGPPGVDRLGRCRVVPALARLSTGVDLGDERRRRVTGRRGRAGGGPLPLTVGTRHPRRRPDAVGGGGRRVPRGVVRGVLRVRVAFPRPARRGGAPGRCGGSSRRRALRGLRDRGRPTCTGRRAGTDGWGRAGASRGRRAGTNGWCRAGPSAGTEGGCRAGAGGGGRTGDRVTVAGRGQRAGGERPVGPGQLHGGWLPAGRLGRGGRGALDPGDEGGGFLARVAVPPVPPLVGPVVHRGTLAERSAVESSNAGTVTVETRSW